MSTQHIYTDGSGGTGLQGGFGIYWGPHDPHNCCGAVSGPGSSARAEVKAVELVTKQIANEQTYATSYIIHTDSQQIVDAHNDGYQRASSSGPQQDLYRNIAKNIQNSKARVIIQYTSGGANHQAAHNLARKGADGSANN